MSILERAPRLISGAGIGNRGGGCFVSSVLENGLVWATTNRDQLIVTRGLVVCHSFL